MRALFFEVEPWEAEYLKRKLSDCSVFCTQEKLSLKIVKQFSDITILGIFVNSQVTKQVLNLLPKLKLIVTLSTGFDHIDLVACKKTGVTVCNVPSYGENTVAEHAMALLLNISRKISESIERTRKGDWNLQGLRGFDLQGKTIGIVGTGRIGKHVAEYANSFRMKVIAWDKFPDKHWAKIQGVSHVSFAKLLAQSNVISLHLPYTKETHHIISMKNLSKIKKGCVLINTARGGLIETKALVIGLEKGIFSALGLDVLEEEGIVKEDRTHISRVYAHDANMKTVLADHVLAEQPSVYITPHNAFNSSEALKRILDTTIENVQAFEKGKPVNVVKE